LAAAWADVADAQVAVVLSDDGMPYEDAADAIRAEFASRPGRTPIVDVVGASATRDGRVALPQRTRIVVTVGTAAARAELDVAPDTPVLGILVPKQAWPPARCVAAQAPRPRCSAIYLDQPLARQFNLIAAALPGRERVGVVAGPGNVEALPEMRHVAAGRGLSLATRTIDGPADLYPTLEGLLPSVDVLLAMPDPAVLTTASARSLLVGAYRFRVPVVAFSESYVRAGAMLAVYSTPREIGRQAAEIIAAALAAPGAPALPPPQYPKYYSIAINHEVARSLGIRLADEQALRLALGGLHE